MWITNIMVWVVGCVFSVNGQRDRVPPPKDMTFDRLMMLAMGGNNKLVSSLTLPDPNKTLAELDMMVTKKQYDALYGSNDGRSKRKAVSDTTVYWTNGVMPYKFAPNHFSAYEQWMIKVAMREWEKYTCVRFREAGPSDSNYVYFQDGFGCNSQLGMVGGRQILNLDKNGCRFKGLYLHEIAHALGVVHEHQRPIRDNYITIQYQNVEPAMKIWFNKYNPGAIASHNVDYEYSSVMHYGVTAFSGNRQQTIRARDPSREEEIGRVYLKELSFTDVEIVNRMYKCVPKSAECDSKVCNGKGYLDQNCNCLCPDGSLDCTRGSPQDTSCSNDAGTDREHWQCNVWAKQGECEANPGFMLSRCAKACGQCGQARQELPETKILCSNIYDDNVCQKWKDELGDCRVNEHWMKLYCKKTCGYCNDFTLNRIPPQTQCLNAHTNDTACESWARKGECIINPRWMPQNCQKACFTCPFDDRTLSTVTSAGSTTTPSGRQSTTPSRLTTTLRMTRPPTITTQPTTQRPVENCKNRYPESDCEIWAKHDHCNKNPTFMHSQCTKSCNKCEDVDGGTDTGTGTDTNTGTGTTNCVNNHKDCQVWADHQHCVINPGYMLKNCQKACRVCTSGLKEAAAQFVAEYNSGVSVSGTFISLFLMLIFVKLFS